MICVPLLSFIGCFYLVLSFIVYVLSSFIGNFYLVLSFYVYVCCNASKYYDLQGLIMSK